MMRLYRIPRPERRVNKECRAVTIAVGILCSDGIALCADRQITDAAGLKYERNKILHKEIMPDHASLALTYSGNPDSAETLFDRLWEARNGLLYEDAKKNH